MNEERRQHRRTPIAKPAEEGTAEQSTQEASGIHDLEGVRPGPGREVAHERDADDVLNRSAARKYDTPRRYEHDEDEAALPANDATLKTKI